MFVAPPAVFSHDGVTVSTHDEGAYQTGRLVIAACARPGPSASFIIRPGGHWGIRLWISLPFVQKIRKGETW